MTFTTEGRTLREVLYFLARKVEAWRAEVGDKAPPWQGPVRATMQVWWPDPGRRD